MLSRRYAVGYSASHDGNRYGSGLMMCTTYYNDVVVAFYSDSETQPALMFCTGILRALLIIHSVVKME